MTRADGYLLTLLVAVSLASYVLMGASHAPAQPAAQVRIESPRGEMEVRLDTDATYEVEGLLGPVTVEIRDGEARVTETRCVERRCVSMGPASEPGDALVCAPNAVTVVVAECGEPLDDVVR
ncbi:MAG: hypothetical protein Kow0056_04210 [Coriobacteriia bacterium]